jgi:hypothetical protein
MSLLDQWRDEATRQRSKKDADIYWSSYFEKEKNAYQAILKDRRQVVEGTVKELSEEFGMEPVEFIGFLDGINTSLTTELDLEKVEEDSQVKLEIAFEKLYFNMLEAKADWLYNLEEWDGILSLDRRQEITNEYKRSKIAVSNKVGRNEPCPCGSGKKYKKCCGA